ncbi:hypothetical protein HDA32_005919 [Spinactinospora alkalitolerans]|uniref:Uncharacterized protein n=1 Tax=Spinactinospora alkalitolerans TaxID=687207 RepID=A0A852U3M9_9ACTN|nr:hypothetical protein [Spinactinospora alkalitolerans]NYE50799.1 hypothetical protein [Spinactinospora alkalitolerans]
MKLLRRRYAERWTIRRTEHLWIATAVDRGADHAPTLIEPDVDAFVRQLEDPPPRAGRGSLLSAPWIAERLTDVGDGVFWNDTPPMA